MQYPGEPPSMVLPLVYDISMNTTQLADKRDTGSASAGVAASLQLKRFSEYSQNPNECTIFPAIRDLLMNLTLPSETQGMPQVSWSCPLGSGTVSFF